MSLPIGALPTLGVRMIEGSADLMVYAVLFDRIAHAGSPARRGARLGFAATLMMTGISLGLAIGGVVGRGLAELTLIVGSLACAGVCVVAMLMRFDEDVAGARPRAGSSRALVAPMLQIFVDRAGAGLLVSTLPLYLASAQMDARSIGTRVGVIMLTLAIGLWPAGRLVDRLGPPRVRAVCTALFCLGLLGVPLSMTAPTGVAMAVSVVVGGSAAGLFASALVLAARARRDAGGMASFYAAGNLGFFAGPVGAAGVLALAGGGAEAFALVFVVFGVAHALVSAASLIAHRLLRVPRSGCDARDSVVTARRRAA